MQLVIVHVIAYLNLVCNIDLVDLSIIGIQFDLHHPMSPLTLTTLERSSHSLMLDQQLVLIHQPGIATPQTLVV